MKASDAAYHVLSDAGEPLHVKDLTSRMIDEGLWHTRGKTPWDTISAILGTEINELGAASRFVRLEANTFDLRRPDDPIPVISQIGAGPKAWMFQGNPTRYDLLGGIGVGSLTNYAMNQHRDHAAYPRRGPRTRVVMGPLRGPSRSRTRDPASCGEPVRAGRGGP